MPLQKLMFPPGIFRDQTHIYDVFFGEIEDAPYQVTI